ncbi:MAG: DUF3267 domain-containing protein [Clostridiaceae bacterium]
MKLVWRGKISKENSFPEAEIPQEAQVFVDGSSPWKGYIAIIPILALAYGAAVIKKLLTPGVHLSCYGLIIGICLAVIFITVHELLHAVCCPSGGTIEFFYSIYGISAVPTSPIPKWRYVFVALCPALILGLIPMFLWVFSPAEYRMFNSIIFGFSVGSLSVCTADISNAVSAVIKMPKGSVLQVSGMKGYWYVPRRINQIHNYRDGSHHS